MNIADLIDELQRVLPSGGFGLRENMGGCAISALYFAKHLSKLGVSNRIVFLSSDWNGCLHAVVRIPFGKTHAYIDSEGVYNFQELVESCGLGVGVEETVLSRVYVQNEIDIGGWNRDYKRRDTPKLYKAIDKVFEQVRV